MSDLNIFKEIEEDLHRKKVAAIWDKYGKYVVGAALVLVLGTAVFVSYKNHKVTSEEDTTAALLSALDVKEKEDAKSVDALADFVKAKAGTGQAALALLQEAAAAVKADDRKKALAIYEGLQTDTTVDDSFHQIAALLWVQTQLDDGDPEILRLKLEPLMVDGAFWAPMAKEYAAHLALKTGDTQKAKRLFTELSQGEKVPPSIAGRATDMLSLDQVGQQ